jgi:hypothetical protein
MNANRLHRTVTQVALSGGMFFFCGIVAAAETNLYDGEWHYALTPYAWIPTRIVANLRFNVPPGLGGSPEVEVNASSILSDLRFAAAFAGEARKGKWALATDFVYVNLGNLNSRVRSVSGPLDMVSIPINASVDTSFKLVIVQGVASYTAARNEQAALDVFGGVRYAGVKTSLGWNLSGEFGLLGASGSLSDKIDLVDGIVGLRGHMLLGDERRWFVPYYIDVGAGNNSNKTWQGYAGAGYHYGWGDLVLVYRYLYYRTSGSTVVNNLHLGGPVLAATFRW